MSKVHGEIIGVFIGLDSSRFEYIASIIAPFQQEFAPIVGGFMLIDNINEYIVARVMNYVPQGELMSIMGQKWLSEVALTPDLIGQDIKTRKVSYQVKIKLLGRLNKSLDTFTPGIKAIPHVTSKVFLPKTKMIEAICNQALIGMEKGIVIGNYWIDENIEIHFNMEELIGKRTFIFARAGYGKSNLMKILASNWKNDYGSLIIFDPEGEYSVTDKKGRPGIMDAIAAILITNRKKVKDDLDINVYDNLKFDLREFHPSFIIPILVIQAKHEMVFFQKLMGLNSNQWVDLVNYLVVKRWRADHIEMANIMEMDDIKSIPPIMNNLIPPIQKLHDPKSNLFKIIENSVQKGFPLIIDISLLDSRSALQFSSTIVSYFFNKNQRKFTGGTEDLNRITFVMEEAQSVIGGTKNVAKFVELAKEGRKYQLGAIFITQQPGSISKDILSQGDNFFVFHLLSMVDLKTLQDTNAHFSNDILNQILNEPIKGKSYMWTSNQPFVLPIKIKNFEVLTKPNKAKEIQSRNNILDPILFEITKFDEKEKDILEKFGLILNNKSINIRDRKTIFSNEIKKKLTKEVFKSLDKDEIKYLEKLDGLAKNENDEPYAISFPYFSELHQKLLIYFSKDNIEEKDNDFNKSIEEKESKQFNERGFCIRCGKNIKFDDDLNTVLCNDCFESYKQFQGDIWGSHCHECGQYQNGLSDQQPFCNTCLRS